MKLRHIPGLATHLTILALTLSAGAPDICADRGRLVIMHTNDTHSQIDPGDDGLGGVARRKTLIDSIRGAEPNTLLVDAGDIVQGTLYFTLYGGEVENAVADMLGYDLRILGNHEFDNGAEQLADKIAGTRSTWLATNYDMRGTRLGKKFVPYTIRQVGDRRIGFIGLNLDPKGMISEGNYNGVRYLDLYKAANATAWHLKHNEGTDMVIALTHIGYEPTGTGTSDLELAARSEDIDIIIGGHSHTTVDPAKGKLRWRVPNAAGDTILITQTGKSGRNLGVITIDLDNLTDDYRLIPVDARLDRTPQPEVAALIAPYRHGVDSLMTVPITRASQEFKAGSAAILNLVADYIKLRGDQIGDTPVDFALTNKGGIRRGLPKGKVSEGMIVTMLPFNNRVEVLEISGKDLAENFDIMAGQGGNGLSREVEAVYDPATGKCTSVTIGGKPLDPDKTYRMATIDYLAGGGDYMQPLTRGRVVAVSPKILSKDYIDYLRANPRLRLSAPDRERMHPAGH